MFSRRDTSWIYGVFASFALVSGALAQDEALRAELFVEADQAMAAANESMAHILAPASYEQASEYYREAESDFERGRSLEGIRRDLAEAVRLFSRATEATNLAQISLRDALAARRAAEITAVGYGETVPLANNETPEGRARNRRIDLLIRPNLEVLSQSLAER